MQYPRFLSIAGSDSGGGAGIQADIKTASALGCYAMTAVTAITAQNTRGVTAIHAIPVDMLKAQIEAVMDDIGIDALKIGMLHSPEVVEVVAWVIRHYGIAKVVLDPVMVSANGDPLITPETVDILVRELFPLASIVTPNLDEAAFLLRRPLTDRTQLDDAARDLLAMGAPTVLLKGAHLPGERIIDIFARAEGDWLRMEGARIPSANIHGSGCTLSSAIASYLALGFALTDAVKAGRDYVINAIAAGAEVETGKGTGPLNHGFAPSAMRLLP
ncbi:MAG: bifunctional hydroxymethylpyrimidine kinase/phosphomethylpyrimidine kinase [Burkholderiaceae bacterium]